jgi:GTP-binding protein
MISEPNNQPILLDARLRRRPLSARHPMVAIVGRPNVGKSRIFNRMIGERRSIVDDTPGVTRDRILGKVERFSGNFLLCDTGGFEPAAGDNIKQSLVRQASFAIDEAALVLLVVDHREGLHPVDEDLMRLLRRSGKPVLVVINKCDPAPAPPSTLEFRRLGTQAIHPISAEHNMGFEGLEEAIARSLYPEHHNQDSSMPLSQDTGPETDAGRALVRMAIVGRPNVGKSSILNALLGEERSIVDPRPGTTRDVVDVTLNAFGKTFEILDTAGIRRKSRVADRFETYSIVRSLGQIEDCDVAALVIDAAEGPTEGDARVAGLAFEQRIPLIIVVNKWDLILNKDSKTLETYRKKVLDALRYVAYAPVLFCSALENQRVSRLLQIAADIHNESSKRISTSLVNQTLRTILEKHTPPLTKSRSSRIKFLYASQVDVNPPRFVVFCSHADDIHFSYKRFVENEFRAAFGFEHIPLAVHFRTRERREFAPENRGPKKLS